MMIKQGEVLVKDLPGIDRAESARTPALQEAEQPEEAVQAAAEAGSRHKNRPQVNLSAVCFSY